MDKIKRSLVVITALCMMLVSGCSKSSSSQDDTSSSAAESSSEAVKESGDPRAADSSETQSPKQEGLSDRIKKAAAFFDNEEYEYVCKVNGTGIDATITLVKNKGMYRQTTDYGIGQAYVICDGSNTYCYDTLTKCFIKEVGKIQTEPAGNIITETVKNELQRTSTHINAQDAKTYDAEEYTYTGGTYITVLDFYFDKTSGDLKKYTATYSVEGRDDDVETREIVKMSTKDITALSFKERALREEYADYNSLTQDKREELCKKIMTERKMTDDDLYNAGLTVYDLKNVSYEKFFTAVVGAAAKKA